MKLATRALLLSLALLVGCSEPPVQPLMPTPMLYPELGIGPLDHIPAENRWKPRRVFYATTRERIGDAQRIEYSNDEGNKVAVGMALVGFGGENVSWADLNRYSRQADRKAVVPLSISGLVEAGRFDPENTKRELNGPMSWLLTELNSSIESARDRDLLIYVHGAKVNFYNACAFAAQLDHFMGRDMTSVAFSWPTRQNIFAYGTGGDVRRAYRHAGALTSLIEQLAAHRSATHPCRGVERRRPTGHPGIARPARPPPGRRPSPTFPPRHHLSGRRRCARRRVPGRPPLAQ